MKDVGINNKVRKLIQNKITHVIYTLQRYIANTE